MTGFKSYACHLQAVTRVLKQRLLDEDEVVHVCPPQLYQDNPGFGVRDVANNVIRLLRKVIKLHICWNWAVTSTLSISST